MPVTRLIAPPDALADDEPLDDELLALPEAAADDDELVLEPQAASTNARVTASRVPANARVYLFTDPPPKEVEFPGVTIYSQLARDASPGCIEGDHVIKAQHIGRPRDRVAPGAPVGKDMR